MGRNKSDINISCNRKNRLILMCYVSNVADFRHSVAKEMSSYRHAIACCLSKLRSDIRAGKKQLRVWLQYACSVSEVLLHPSVAPLVLLRYSIGFTEDVRYIHGRCTEVPRCCDESLTLVSRRCNENLTKVYATANECLQVLMKPDSWFLRADVHGVQNPCSFTEVSNRALKYMVG